MSNASQEKSDQDERLAVVRPPSHIILATDFSARCDRAQDRAVQLAVEWNAGLTAVHALSDLSLTDDASVREAYRRAAMRNADILRDELDCVEGLRSSAIVEQGNVEAVILEAAAKEKADLIVTGIARTGPLAQVLIGNTATALARTSPVPLLVVKRRVLDTDARAIVATDLSESSEPALMVALRWFAFRHLALFHAFDPPYRSLAEDKAAYDSKFEAAALEECQDFLRNVAGQDAATRFDIIARGGDPVIGLRRLANEADTDLVIAGTHGRTGLLNVLVGSVASRILSDVPCDVLVVPSRPR
jgi:nucleotide-binding universal stress UspA family protein